jgi:hypothetical protein
MDSIFKNEAGEERVSVIDLEKLIVLIIRLLRRDLNKLVKKNWNQWNYKIRGS